MGTWLQNCSLLVVTERNWCKQNFGNDSTLIWRKKSLNMGLDPAYWFWASLRSRAPFHVFQFDSVWVPWEYDLNFKLKHTVDISTCRWVQLFCAFVVSHIPPCVSYKKLESNWSAMRSIAFWISSITLYWKTLWWDIWGIRTKKCT